MMNKDKLTQANATLWQAYTLLHLTTRDAVEDDEILEELSKLIEKKRKSKLKG